MTQDAYISWAKKWTFKPSCEGESSFTHQKFTLYNNIGLLMGHGAVVNREYKLEGYRRINKFVNEVLYWVVS